MKTTLNALIALVVVTVLSTTLYAQGQAPQTTGAMDINVAKNATNDLVSSKAPGPYFASAASGGFATFHFFGEPFQPIILVSGDLNPGIHAYSSLGDQQWDIGQLPLSNPLHIPAGLTTWADGNVPGIGVNDLFWTDASGFMGVNAPVPTALPLGVAATFQAVIRDSVQVISFTNAIELTITL